MSNHFTGLSLGPPLGDQRLDLCDLYAFAAPADPDKTVLILNANPRADALHPNAVYRLAVDNDGDLRNDFAFSFVFSEPQEGRQTVDVFLATGRDARSPEAVGERIFESVDVSFGQTPNIVQSGSFTFFAGARSDAFFFDFDGIQNLFDISGGRNSPHPISAADHPGRGWIRTLRPTFSRSRSRCPPPPSAPTRTSESGDVAACAARTAPCSTWTAPATLR